MSKIDIDKFICSIMSFDPVSNEVKYLIKEALRLQGLEYKDGKIVEEDVFKTIYVICQKRLLYNKCNGSCIHYEIGEIETLSCLREKCGITDEMIRDHFRPATPEEIPQEPKQENTLKDAVEARKEIITCAEDFQKQNPSDGELTEFEKEIAHVFVYKCYDGNLETEEEIHNAHRQYYDDAKFFAPMLLAKARKQIASEINIDERVQKFKDGVKENPHGILACLTLHGAYKLGINDTLKAIKGE